jgi:hypothetical protein
MESVSERKFGTLASDSNQNCARNEVLMGTFRFRGNPAPKLAKKCSAWTSLPKLPPESVLPVVQVTKFAQAKRRLERSPNGRVKCNLIKKLIWRCFPASHSSLQIRESSADRLLGLELLPRLPPGSRVRLRPVAVGSEMACGGLKGSHKGTVALGDEWNPYLETSE